MAQRSPGLPTPPSGLPVGSFDTYADAQRAVDYLSDNRFPIERSSIIGTDLRLVENVLGRLTTARAALAGAASGAWFGLFIGLLLSFFSTSANPIGPIITSLVCGIVFFAVFAAVGYSATRGRRDFTSQSQMVAGRYDVLCQPRSAEKARELLAKLAMGTGSAPTE